MTCVSQYFNIFSLVLAVFVHMHIFLTQQLSSSTQHLMEGTLQVKKKKKIIAKILIFPLLPSAVLMH